jgi:hypothetical protein
MDEERTELSVGEVSAPLRRWADYRDAIRRKPDLPRRTSEPPDLQVSRPDGDFGHAKYPVMAVRAFMEANGMELPSAMRLDNRGGDRP